MGYRKLATEKPGRTRAVEVGLSLALAAGTVSLVLGGAELVARLCEPPTAAAPADYIADWQAWEGDFYTVKSAAVGWPPWEDYNTEGLRDREHTVQKRPGAWRVACLGDSVTLGWGIRPQQAWPQMLEELSAASGRDLDVMNVALGGWSTRQELIAYRRIVRRYRPDQVLLGICLNDVAEMQNNLSRPPRWLAQLHRRSALVRWIVDARKREIGAVEELFTSADSPKVREGYERVFTDLRTLRDEVRADGASFAILVFPFRFQVTPGVSAPIAQRTIAAFCGREGIPLLDLLPALASVGESAFLDYDHLNPAGASRVAEEVLESHLLPAERTVPSGSTAMPALMPGGQPGNGAVPGLLLAAGLKDPVEGRRVAAARALAMRGEAAAPFVPDLTGALDDRSRVVRAAAAWALGEVGPAAAPATPDLLRLLRDADPLVRAGAAYALGATGAAARDSALKLIERLDDPDERVRWQAGEALAEIGLDADLVGPLVRLVRDAVGPGRGLAAEALGRVGPGARAAVPDLIAAASDPRPEVRWRAVWALGRIGPAAGAAVPVLRAALADPEARWRAAEALGGIGPGAVEAVPDLVALLSDPSSNVRWRAATALGAIGARLAAPALAKAVGDPAENVRLAGVIGLRQVRAEPSLATPAFLAALSDTDSRVRLQAVRGLGHLAAPSGAARRALEAAGDDPDAGVRAEAARMLWKRGRQRHE